MSFISGCVQSKARRTAPTRIRTRRSQNTLVFTQIGIIPAPTQAVLVTDIIGGTGYFTAHVKIVVPEACGVSFVKTVGSRGCRILYLVSVRKVVSYVLCSLCKYGLLAGGEKKDALKVSSVLILHGVR